MKKLILTLALASLLVLPALALAQSGSQQSGGGRAAKNSGGFTGPNASLATVAEALAMNSEDLVTLVGKIETMVGHEKYQFSDGAGSIVLRISDKRWRGLEVGPEDTVEIVGEIERAAGHVEVNVKRITKK